MLRSKRDGSPVPFFEDTASRDWAKINGLDSSSQLSTSIEKESEQLKNEKETVLKISEKNQQQIKNHILKWKYSVIFGN